jgi:hypothetical protein
MISTAQRLILFALCLLATPPAWAATFTVLNTSNSGSGSLRLAISDAQSSPGADIIVFDTSLIQQAITIVLNSELLITASSDVTMDVSHLAWPVTLTVAGGQNDRIFSVDAGSRLSLKNFVLTGGKGAGASDSGRGGAIRNAGTLELDACYVHGNPAPNNGGGMHNSGTATLTRCTFANNTTVFVGGGINNDGTLTATNCTFTTNTASGNGGGGVNATGGAVSTTLVHCTITANAAPAVSGGGVRRAGGSFSLQNCIVTENTADTNADLSGTITQIGNNRTTGTAGVFLLADYGGPVPTMPPSFDSPVIDAVSSGNEAPGVTTDARGALRLIDGDLDGTIRADIGAAEYYDSRHFTVGNTNNAGSGSLREVLLIAASVPGANVISFDPSLDGQTIHLTSTHPGDIYSAILIDDRSRVTVDASALPDGLTIDDGTNTTYRLFAIAPDSNVSMVGLTLDQGGGSGFNTTGGAIISNQATLTLDQCTLSGNSARMGGGIDMFKGSLTLTNCTFVNNTASLYGGGIANRNGQLTMTHCTITGNTAPAGQGSGIANSGSDPAPQTEVQNCIIVGNTSSDLHIVSGPTNTFVSLGGNVIGTGQATTAFTQTNDVIGITAATLSLAPLASYGGSTQTMPPLPGSPAVDRAVSSSVSIDQRGLSRTGMAMPMALANPTAVPRRWTSSWSRPVRMRTTSPPLTAAASLCVRQCGR